MFLQCYRFDCCYRGLNRNFYTFSWTFGEKINDFDRCIKNLTFREFRKVLLVLIHLDIYTHFSWWLTAWFSSSTSVVSIKAFTLVEKTLVENSFSLYFSSKSRHHHKLKVVIILDSSRYSKSKFSVKTALNRIIHTFARKLNGEVIYWVPWIWILLFLIFEKELIALVHQKLQFLSSP